MKLVERQIYKQTSPVYKVLKDLCLSANNLYNDSLYLIRQHYFHLTNKQFTEDLLSEHKSLCPNFYDIDLILKSKHNVNHKCLSANTAQEIEKIAVRNFKSFLSLNKLFKEGSLTDKPNLPRYRKAGSMFNVIFNAKELPKTFFETGIGKLPKIKTRIQTKNFKTCTQIRLIPKHNRIIIEFIYDVDIPMLMPDNGNYLAIDPGLDNLLSCITNISDLNPLIYDGKPLKSFNRWFNKVKAQMQSELPTGVYWSNRLSDLMIKRENKINDYFHKVSRHLINYAVKYSINTIILGKNKEWKQNINIGKINNQNFVYIPYDKLYSMIKYKAMLAGINVVEQEESYTSKCSFFDNDYIPTYGVDDEMFKSSGRRIKRGMFKTSDGFMFNADINGSLNIMKKYLNVDSKLILSRESSGRVNSPVKVRFSF